MAKNNPSSVRIQDVTRRAWRTTVLTGIALVVLTMFLGMGYLVYRGQMSDGPLLLYAGVILGYLLHAVRELL